MGLEEELATFLVRGPDKVPRSGLRAGVLKETQQYLSVQDKSLGKANK